AYTTLVSADRHRIVEAAVRPQRIQATVERKRRIRADIGRIGFTVVADMLDDAVGPIGREPDRSTKIAFHAEQAADFGVIRTQHLIDVFRRHAELFGTLPGIENPTGDVEPARIARTHGGAKRLLGDDLGQNDVVAGHVELGAVAGDAGSVRGVGVATAVQISLNGFGAR